MEELFSSWKKSIDCRVSLRDFGEMVSERIPYIINSSNISKGSSPIISKDITENNIFFNQIYPCVSSISANI